MLSLQPRLQQRSPFDSSQGPLGKCQSPPPSSFFAFFFFCSRHFRRRFLSTISRGEKTLPKINQHSCAPATRQTEQALFDLHLAASECQSD